MLILVLYILIICNSTHLHKQGTVFLQADPLPVGQGEQLVVVHDRVHALHPQRVHVAVKEDVLPLVLLRGSVDLSGRGKCGYNSSANENLRIL